MSITPSRVYARTSGVSPLYVHLSMEATTASSTSNPFHDLEYYTDWGDTGAGTWAYGVQAGQTTRYSRGPIAAHVYEITEGGGDQTFTVTQYMYDGTTLNSATQVITVYDPQGSNGFPTTNTICFSNVGLTSGGPPGATYAAATSSFATVIASVASGKRVLLNRGDTFTTSTSSNTTGDNKWCIGAWGSGAKPIVSSTLASAFSSVLDIGTGTDGRVMDLDVRGNDSDNVYWISMQNASGNDQISFLRVESRNFMTNYILTGSHRPSEFCIIGCYLHDIGNNAVAVAYGIYMEAAKYAIMGTRIDSVVVTNTGHQIRAPKGSRGMISNCELSDPDTGSLIKFHANVGEPSVYNICSYNVAKGKNTSVNFIDYGPGVAAVDERIEDLIMEGNWFKLYYLSGAAFGVVLESTVRVSVRNNLFDMDDADAISQGLRIFKNSSAPNPTDNWGYNNTFYNNTTGGGFRCINNEANATNSIFKNNICYLPSKTTPVVVNDAGTGTVTSNNTTNFVSNPFVASVPATPALADFKLSGGGYATAGGTAVMQIYEDLFLKWRTGTMDMGIAAFVESGTPPWASVTNTASMSWLKS